MKNFSKKLQLINIYLYFLNLKSKNKIYSKFKIIIYKYQQL